MSKIGVGLTSYNRPNHLMTWDAMVDATIKDTNHNIELYIAKDTHSYRQGVAKRKNECLRELGECDYYFLYDDDCFPIKEGWADFFIDAHKLSGQHHFLYLLETPMIKKIKSTPIIIQNPNVNDNDVRGFTIAGASSLTIINEYNNSAGCFMFLTKEAVQKVGAFNEDFGLYGFEHAEYTKRVHLAKLNSMGENLCPQGTSDYLYAMDFQNNLPFNKELKHTSSISPKEAEESVRKAMEIWKFPIVNIYRPI